MTIKQSPLSTPVEFADPALEARFCILRSSCTPCKLCPLQFPGRNVIVADTVGGVNISSQSVVVCGSMDSTRSTLDWLLEGVSAAALLAASADVWMHWSILPARIPVHFDAAGNPNAW